MLTGTNLMGVAVHEVCSRLQLILNIIVSLHRNCFQFKQLDLLTIPKEVLS